MDIVSDFEAESSTKKPKFSTSAVADTAAAGPSSNQVLTGLVPTPDEETGREVEAGGWLDLQVKKSVSTL